MRQLNAFLEVTGPNPLPTWLSTMTPPTTTEISEKKWHQQETWQSMVYTKAADNLLLELPVRDRYAVYNCTGSYFAATAALQRECWERFSVAHRSLTQQLGRLLPVVLPDTGA